MDSKEDELFELLSDSTTRSILSILTKASQELSVTELATRLVSETDSGIYSGADENDTEQIIVSLHHNYLPRLEEAGLIHYDREIHAIWKATDTTIEVDWQELTALSDVFPDAYTGNNEPPIGIIEGQDTVYEYCRDLADWAESELFLIYTSDELLDEACLPHAKDAIERGVAFHAGAKGAGARAFFRECLPEATVWDPQLDWMNTDSRDLSVSRVVFADRESVAIGLWDESMPEGSNTEIAIVGEGQTNPLVVLARELLGPRLDHLDYQSDDFLEELPFDSE